MSEFEKNKGLMNGKGENDVEWITVNGSHIPIEEGEEVGDAIKKHFNQKDSSVNNRPIKSFKDQVESVLDGTYNDLHITLREDTPKILQEIGIPNKPMLMTAKHTYLVINGKGKYNSPTDNYHNLGKETFLNIPKFLESPILAFQSDKNLDDIIAIINAVDKKGNLVIVPIRINGKGNKDYIGIDANVVKSAYGKNNLQGFIDKNVTKDNLLLVENKKIRNLR